MADSEVKLRITTDATGAITGMKAFHNAIGDVERAGANFSGKIKDHWLGLGRTSAAMAATLAAAALTAKKAFDLMEEGARSAQSEAAFRNAANAFKINADQMIGDLERVTNKTVDSSDLMQQSMRMITAGLKADDIVSVAKMSRTAAVRAGEDVGTAFRNIGDAIMSGRERALRGYQLLTKDQTDLITKVKAAGHEVNLLEPILLNAAIQHAALGDEIARDVERFQQFRAIIKDTKDEIGKLADTITGETLSALKWFFGGGLKTAHEVPLDMLGRPIGGAGGGVFPQSAADNIVDEIMGGSVPDAQKRLEDWQKRMNALAKSKGTADTIAQYDRALKDFFRSVDEMDPAMSELDKQLSKFDARVDDLITKAQELKQPITGIMDAWVKGRQFLTAADLEKREAAFAEAWGKSYLEFRSLQEEITEKELSEIDKRIAAEDRWARNMIEKLGLELTPELEERINAISTKAKQRILQDQARAEMESSIRQQLAAVQVAGEQYLMSRADVAARTITLNEQLLAQYQADLDALKGKDAAAELTLADKIADLNLELQRSDYLLKQLRGTMAGGYDFGWQRFMTDTIGTDFERGERMARSTADAWMRAFDDGFFKLFKGEWDSMLDIVENFADDMLRVLSRTFAESAMNAIFAPAGGGGLTSLLSTGLSFLSLGFGSSGSAATSAESSLYWGGATPAASPYVGYAAEGGPIYPGRPYVVGEQGPELIVPQAAGTVIPNGQYGNTLSITVPVSIGPDHKALAARIQSAIDRAVRREVEDLL